MGERDDSHAGFRCLRRDGRGLLRPGLHALHFHDDVSSTNRLSNATQNLIGETQRASDALISNYGQVGGRLSQYLDRAQGTLGQGVNSAVLTAQGSNVGYAPCVAGGSAGSGMLANALDLNGQAGNAAAPAAFTGSPGYQYQVDQAAQRAAAESGMLGSGNTFDAVTKLVSNLANQNYANWRNSLSGLGSQGVIANLGVSANDKVAAAALYGGGTAGGGYDQTTGTQLGTLSQLLGNQQASLQSGLGSNLANLQTGYANSLVGNNNSATNAIAGNDLSLGRAQHSAANSNNGLLSNLLKNVAGAELTYGGGSGSVLGGLLSSGLNGLQEANQNRSYL